jgi:hypothetical protein
MNNTSMWIKGNMYKLCGRMCQHMVGPSCSYGYYSSYIYIVDIAL